MKPSTRAALALLAALPLLATAQTMKPGLWEMSQKMGGNAKADAAMAAMQQQQMASMTPAQRKQMQDMLAKQGMSVPEVGAGGALSMRHCVTPEMAARNEPPPMAEGKCSSKVASRSASELKMSFQCSEPPSSGESTVRYQSDSAYTTLTHVTTQVSGKPERTTIEGTGRWVAADCGAVKPR